MKRMSTRDKIAVVAQDEGWKCVRDIAPVQEFRRGNLEVTVGYDKRGHLEWITLFRDPDGVNEPLSRYGLLAKEGPGTGGGEIKLKVPNKFAIVRTWLEKGGEWSFQTTTS